MNYDASSGRAKNEENINQYLPTQCLTAGVRCGKELHWMPRYPSMLADQQSCYLIVISLKSGIVP